MKLFIDTADIAQIKETYSWGIIDGVTTNPSHVAKTGRPAAAVYRDICAIVDGPISLETLSLTAPEMIAEGRELAKFHRNVVVKIPMTREGMKAVKVLAAEGIKTNVTVTFSPLQALLAAKCGATYISPFVGRLDSFGHTGMDLVRQIKQIYTNYGYKTEIIVSDLSLLSGRDEGSSGGGYSRPAGGSSSSANFDQRPPAGQDDIAQSAEISDDDIPF